MTYYNTCGFCVPKLTRMYHQHYTAPPRTEPYVYRINEEEVDGTGLLAISPQTQTIAKNMVFNVYFHGTFTHTLPDYLSHSAFKNVLE